MIRLLLNSASKGQKLSILIYHQVVQEEEFRKAFDPSQREFDRQMGLISKYFHPMGLIEAINALRNGTLPERAIAVTFDDGYANNYHTALPILQKHGIPATFFIASEFLNGGIMWNDAVLETFMRSHGGLDLQEANLGRFPPAKGEERLKQAQEVLNLLKRLPFEERTEKVAEITRSRALPDNLMMTDDHVRKLHDAGMEIGGHTLSHPILTRVSLDEAYKQIIQNKQQLERIIGAPLRSFAYPNGRPDQDYNKKITELVSQAGYEIAVTTSAGVSTRDTPVLELPRYTPWRRKPRGFLTQMLTNYRTEPLFSS